MPIQKKLWIKFSIRQVIQTGVTNRLLYIPNSHKVYVEGSRPDLQVSMREIQLTPTEAAKGMKDDRSIRVFDTCVRATQTTRSQRLLVQVWKINLRNTISAAASSIPKGSQGNRKTSQTLRYPQKVCHQVNRFTCSKVIILRRISFASIKLNTRVRGQGLVCEQSVPKDVKKIRPQLQTASQFTQGHAIINRDIPYSLAFGPDC